MLSLVKKVLYLVRPYGLKKLVLVVLLSLTQGLVQVVGVTSVFPFLSLATDTEGFVDSSIGKRILAPLPEMDNGQILVVAGAFAIFMLFFANGVNLFSEWYRARYAHRCGHWLRGRVLRAIFSQPYNYFLANHTGVIHKKVTSDVSQFATGVLLPLLDGFASSLTVLLLVGSLFIINPSAAIGAGIILGGFYFLVFVLLAPVRKATSDGLKESNRAMGIEMLHLSEGIKTIKASRTEGYFIDHLGSYSYSLAVLLARLPLLNNSTRYIIEPIAFGGLVLFVVFLAKDGEDLTKFLPVIGVMALVGYRLMPAVQQLYAQISQLSASRHSLEEVYEEFADAGSNPIGFENSEPLKWKESIHFDKVGFSYKGADSAVFENLDLDIPQYSSIAIVGETGSGKSTIIDLLIGLHKPSSGRIMIDNTELTVDCLRAWRGCIGYVPQEVFLVDDTITKNIAFGIPETAIDHDRVTEVCQMAQISEDIENKIDGAYEFIVGERGNRLSGGQKQRIGLARALYHKPSLLILDEATSALDSEKEQAVVESLGQLKGKITTVVIAHRLETIKHCDQTIDLTLIKQKFNL